MDQSKKLSTGDGHITSGELGQQPGNGKKEMSVASVLEKDQEKQNHGVDINDEVEESLDDDASEARRRRGA